MILIVQYNKYMQHTLDCTHPHTPLLSLDCTGLQQTTCTNKAIFADLSKMSHRGKASNKMIV